MHVAASRNLRRDKLTIMADGTGWYSDNFSIKWASETDHGYDWTELWLSDGGVLVLRTSGGGLLVPSPHTWVHIHTAKLKRAEYPADWEPDA